MLRRIVNLIFGTVLLSLGIVLTIHSQTGASPWDVFHLGLGETLGITVGRANQLTGYVVLALAALLGEYPGWGTLFNAYFVGFTMDLIRAYGLIPFAPPGWQQWMMLVGGTFLMAMGTFFYLSAELGSGPRDSVMMGLIKKATQPVWRIRLTLESIALIIGWFLGGLVGPGTLFIAVFLGLILQTFFKVFQKKASDIHHRCIWDDYVVVKDYYQTLRVKGRKENS